MHTFVHCISPLDNPLVLAAKSAGSASITAAESFNIQCIHATQTWAWNASSAFWVTALMSSSGFVRERISGESLLVL